MTSTPTPPTPPRTLLRSRSHRVIAGVAGGVGEYFSVDPVLVRLMLVLLTLVGGLGALLYLTAWLIVPEAAPDPNQPAEDDRGTKHAWLAVGALSLIVIMGGIGGLGSGFGFDGHLVWPLMLIFVGGAVLWIRSNRPPVALTPAPVPSSPSGTSARTSSAMVVAPPRYSPAPAAAPIASDAPTNEVPTTEMAPTDTIAVEQPAAPARPAHTRSVLRRVLPVIGRGLLIVFAFVFTLAIAILAVAAFEGAGTLDMTGFEAIVVSLVALGFAIWLGIAIHRVPELIACALAIAIVCAGAAWLRPPLRGGYGARDIRPQSAASVQRSYQLAAGRLRVDLSDVVLPDANQSVSMKLGMGLAQVVVPPDTTVVLDAHMGLGQICVFGRRDAGLDVSNVSTTAAVPAAPVVLPATAPAGATGTKTLHLNTQVGTGSIVIARTGLGLQRACG
jgi:phage shock protein PspC (stress-responsive transcriptional regulator)